MIEAPKVIAFHTLPNGGCGGKVVLTSDTHAEQVIPSRVGNTLLERMQETQGMPYHSPTLQFKAHTHGGYVDFEPVNPFAKDLCRFAGRKQLTADQKKQLEDMGFAVEVRS